MSSICEWQHVLNEWTEVVQPRINYLIEGRVFNLGDQHLDEYKKLDRELRIRSLQEIDTLPINTFGAIGDTVPVLKAESVLWLLPILLRNGSLSNEPVYAMSVIDSLRQRVAVLPDWPTTKSRISENTREVLYELALKCCQLGWEDERRVRKRAEECDAILRERKRGHSELSR